MPTRVPRIDPSSASTACRQLFTARPARNAIDVTSDAWNITSPRPSVKAVTMLKLLGGGGSSTRGKSISVPTPSRTQVVTMNGNVYVGNGRNLLMAQVTTAEAAQP